jgi:hypothetical protein
MQDGCFEYPDFLTYGCCFINYRLVGGVTKASADDRAYRYQVPTGFARPGLTAERIFPIYYVKRLQRF